MVTIVLEAAHESPETVSLGDFCHDRAIRE